MLALFALQDIFLSVRGIGENNSTTWCVAVLIVTQFASIIRFGLYVIGVPLRNLDNDY
jgi:hypothetical protein